MKSLLPEIDMIDAETTLERVAKAIALADGSSWDSISTNNQQDHYRVLALSALCAIRIPTPEMAVAAADKMVEMGKFQQVDGVMFTAMWMAAINAAMKVQKDDQRIS